MAEETVTVGDTEVQITETDDGFEVTEVEDDPEPGTPEKFTQETGFGDGDSLSYGSIDEVFGSSGAKVKVYVSDETYDVFGSEDMETIIEAGWIPAYVEFESGYVMFKDEDY